MESQSTTQDKEKEPLREVSAADNKSGLRLGNVFCKIGEGWTCVITRTEGPDAGKVFLKCGENCTCTIDGEVVSQELNLPPDVVSGSGSQTFCECGEGWSCFISRTEDHDAGKGFYECSGRCTCVADAK